MRLPVFLDLLRHVAARGCASLARGRASRAGGRASLVGGRALLVGGCVVLLGGCGLLPQSTDDDQVVVFAAADRVAAPQIVGETIDGETLALADHDGPVVVNFWASWCGPCRDEAPHLNAVAQAYADQGVSVLGVNAKDDLANAQAFAQGNLRFASWFDPDQSIASGFGDASPVGLPSTLILDADHRVAVRFFGTVTGATLGPALEQVLDEGGNP